MGLTARERPYVYVRDYSVIGTTNDDQCGSRSHRYLKNQVTRLQSTILCRSSSLKYLLDVDHALANAVACPCHYRETQAVVTCINSE